MLKFYHFPYKMSFYVVFILAEIILRSESVQGFAQWEVSRL
jgi:hypothetical protein